MKTNDGGETWQEIHNGQNTNHLYDIVMVGPDIGFAVGEADVGCIDGIAAGVAVVVGYNVDVAVVGDVVGGIH